MNNVKAPYNVNKLTAEVAFKALDNLELYRINVARLSPNNCYQVSDYILTYVPTYIPYLYRYFHTCLTCTYVHTVHILPYIQKMCLHTYIHSYMHFLPMYRILEERNFLLDGLRRLQPNLIQKIHPTDANFILFVIPKAQEIYKRMADAGIVCRYRCDFIPLMLCST